MHGAAMLVVVAWLFRPVVLFMSAVPLCIMLRLAWEGELFKVGDESLSSYYLGKPSLHPQLQNTAKKKGSSTSTLDAIKAINSFGVG